MADRNRRRDRPPLDPERLNELALTYVGRFATTRAKLGQYLNRKLRERGWSGETEADVEAIAERLSGLGYVDDAAFALSKSRALTARGYGARRVRESLRAAGVEEADAEPARDAAEEQAVDAALRFAAKRRFGPYAEELADPAKRQRQLASMVRAGHGFSLAAAILKIGPGEPFDIETLREMA